jgi:aspartyl-tRNA(Asn)/glutamyl-tRNA(Gln) amidotransferase subunit A
MRLAVDAPTASVLAAAVRRGELTATELVDAALSRAAATEPQLAAFTLIDAARAGDEARLLDVEAAAGKWRGPLHGVPVAVKDLYDVAGEVTTAGSQVPPSSAPAGADAVAVARLRAAGAIVIGRTRTHEYAWGLTTQHSVLGGTRNPYDPARVPGGSSGGSAAAVAAGVVPLALGTDTAGSIRLPAAWCGLVGHKPTHGRISLAGVVPLAPSFDHAGALVRSVDDARLVLGVLTGIDVSQGRHARELSGLRIGVPEDASGRAADDSVRAVITTSVQSAVGAGAVRRDVVGPEWSTMRDTFFALQAVEAVAYHRSTGNWPEHAELYGDDVRARLHRAESFTDDQVTAAQQALAGIRERVEELFATVDVLLQPVAGSGPSRTDTPDTVTVNGQAADLREHVLPHTLLASLCGLPACSVPVGADADGLPVGLQVIGPVGADALVLDVAEALMGLQR